MKSSFSQISALFPHPLSPPFFPPFVCEGPFWYLVLARSPALPREGQRTDELET